MIDKLPIELIERIFDMISMSGRRRRETLLPMLTLCSHLSLAVKRQLYKSLFIHASRQCPSLLAGFENTNEVFSSCVHQLHLVISDKEADQEAEDGIPLESALRILSQTRNMQALSISCAGIDPHHPELISALANKHKLHRISLEFEEEAPLDLEVLQYQYLPQWPRLTRMSLSGFWRPLPLAEKHAIYQPFAAMNLTELDIKNGSLLDLDFVALLHACASTLQSLRITKVSSLSMTAFRSGLANIGGIDKLEIRDCTFTDQTPQPPAPPPVPQFPPLNMFTGLAGQRSLIFNRPFPMNHRLANLLPLQPPQPPVQPPQPPPLVWNASDIVFPENTLFRLCPFITELSLCSDLLMTSGSLTQLFQLLPLQHLELDSALPIFPVDVLVEALENVPRSEQVLMGARGGGRLQSLAVGKKMKWLNEDGNKKLQRACEGRDVSLLWI